MHLPFQLPPWKAGNSVPVIRSVPHQLALDSVHMGCHMARGSRWSYRLQGQSQLPLRRHSCSIASLCSCPSGHSSPWPRSGEAPCNSHLTERETLPQKGSQRRVWSQTITRESPSNDTDVFLIEKY